MINNDIVRYDIKWFCKWQVFKFHLLKIDLPTISWLTQKLMYNAVTLCFHVDSQAQFVHDYELHNIVKQIIKNTLHDIDIKCLDASAAMVAMCECVCQYFLDVQVVGGNMDQIHSVDGDR